MSLSGTFTFTSHENFEDWLKAAGANDEQVKKATAVKPTLVIAETSSGLTITGKSGDKEATNTVTYGQDSPMELGGVKYTMKVDKTATGYSGTIKIKEQSGTTTTDISGNSLTRTFTLGGVTTKRIYTKS